MKIKVIELTTNFEDMTLHAVDAIEHAGVVVLQSEQVECAKEIAERNSNIITFDDLFEEAEDFDALYVAGAQRIVKEGLDKTLVFCVLGDTGTNGFVNELQVRGIEIEYISCGGQTAAALTMARQEMEIGEYQVIDARSLKDLVFDTSKAMVITGIDNWYAAEGVKYALCEYYAEDTMGILYASGKAEQIKLYELDRDVLLGTGGIYILQKEPPYQKERYGLYDLMRIVRVLRGENGCPWDKEQTHESLRQYILEEAYEAVDAIDAEDVCALYDELGDAFLQIALHAQIGKECGEFDIDDVATAVCKKMIHRHPHVFAETAVDTTQEVITNWEAIKREEKKNESFVSVLRDIPRCMGAMMRAYKLQKKASAIGFDWKEPEKAFLKVEEELEEWKVELLAGKREAAEEEAGDLLFSIINVLRLQKTNPELCLNMTCEKFIERMGHMEKNSEKELSELTLLELDQLWEKAKGEKVDRIGKK